MGAYDWWGYRNTVLRRPRKDVLHDELCDERARRHAGGLGGTCQQRHQVRLEGYRQRGLTNRSTRSRGRLRVRNQPLYLREGCRFWQVPFFKAADQRGAAPEAASRRLLGQPVVFTPGFEPSTKLTIGGCDHHG